jgi:hypothetical protein
LVIALPLLAIGLLLGWFLTRRQHRNTDRYRLIALCVAPAAGLIGFACLAVALNAVASDSSRLRSVFPDIDLASISGLRSENSIWTGDRLFIGFVAKPEVVDGIVQRHGMTLNGDTPIAGEKPDWWSDNACSHGRNRWGFGDYKSFTVGRMQDDPRGWERIQLLYCDRDGQVLIAARKPRD